MLIPIAAITIERRLLRRTIDPDKLRSLAEDIERNSLLQPIAVRTLDGHGYALIAGRRRVEAHKLLGRETIEAHILDNAVSDELRGAAENIKRVQLSPLEEADIVGDLHDLDNLSIADIAERTGHGTSWVQDRLAIRALPGSFQDAVHARQLSISAALLLSTIDDIAYRDYLLHIAKTNGATVHQVQAWTQEYAARQAMARPGGLLGDIPQLPPMPEAPHQPCFSCEAPTPNDHVILLRFCVTCLEEMQAERARLATLPPQPPGRPVALHHAEE